MEHRIRIDVSELWYVYNCIGTIIGTCDSEEEAIELANSRKRRFSVFDYNVSKMGRIYTTKKTPE